MMKKMVMLLMACMLVFSFTAPNLVEAKTTYKAPKKSYTPTNPQKAPTDNVTRNDSGSPTAKTPAAATPPAKPGFFSGGLMKGIMIGGLAGLLFGSMFGNLGALGNILGLLVNVLAIFLLFVIIKNIVVYFRNKRKENQKRFE